jgi:uncharacterized RDD family membrane protein YckC
VTPAASRVREVTTPEGIALRVTIAPLPERAAAAAYDLFLVTLCVVAAAIAVMVFSTFLSMSDVGLVVVLLGVFLARNFYFTWFELRRNGSTPGKRHFGVRVIDAAGGPLRAEAVITRNFLRELEMFLPISLIAAPEQLWPGSSGAVRLLAGAWALVFAFLPLFNRDRRRAGDLAAGTLVVAVPEHALQSDLAAPERGRGQRERIEFTREQLDVYGVFELQVLEDLLRRTTHARREELEVVCAKIKKKIGWPRERWDVDPRLFLRDFYAAQRAVLEQKMLLGRRKADQRDDAAG